MTEKHELEKYDPLAHANKKICATAVCVRRPDPSQFVCHRVACVVCTLVQWLLGLVACLFFAETSAISASAPASHFIKTPVLSRSVVLLLARRLGPTYRDLGVVYGRRRRGFFVKQLHTKARHQCQFVCTRCVFLKRKTRCSSLLPLGYTAACGRLSVGALAAG